MVEQRVRLQATDTAETTTFDHVDIKPWDRTDFVTRHDGWNVFPMMVCGSCVNV